MDRKTKIDLLWITLITLAMQLFWAARLQHPSYFDAYYYTVNGRNLAFGDGWQENVIWQYLDDPDGFPTPSHTYWMPLTSMIAALGYAIGGDNFRAAQAPFFLMALFLPWLAYAVSRRIAPQERWQARTAALFTAVGGYYTAYWAQPSTFALYAWTGGGFLLALGMAGELTQNHGGTKERRRLALWLAAGILAGLSHLTRADGVLLLVVGGIVWLWLTINSQRTTENNQQLAVRRSPLAALALLAGGYFLIMGGWFWHMWRVTGRPLATVGAQTIFLTNYNDTFAYNRQFNLQSYLDWGLGNILQSKLTAVSLAAQTFIAVTGLIFLSVFIVWAWVALRKGETKWFLRPFTLYTILLFAAMSLIFTFPGPRGSLLHSSSALWPWAMALAAAGIGMVVDAIGKRLSHWQPEKSKPLFAIMFVFVAFSVSFLLSGRQTLMREEGELYAQIGAMLPPDAAVMSGEPPIFHYHTGLKTAVLPNEPPQIVLEAMERYGIEYLILNRDRVPPMADLYEGKAIVPQLELMQTFEIKTVDGETNLFKLYRRTAEE